MKFITLHLENFQAHKDTRVSFTDGVNIIVGPSDTGKSSILRALHKLVRDKPAGNDFINEDATSVKLTLTFERDDGVICTIIREVTPSKNLYYLNDTEFGGFGREIPQEIQNALEMFLIDLDNKETVDFHFSDQYEPPFMVAKGSAGTRSKLLGRIAGLHILDAAIKTSNKDIKNTLQKHLVLVDEGNKIQETLTNLPDPTKFETVLNQCEKETEKIEKLIQRSEQLKKISGNLSIIISEGKRLKNIITDFPNVEVDFKDLYTKIQTLEKLKQIQANLVNIDTQIQEISKKHVPEINVNFDALKQQVKLLEDLIHLEASLNLVNTALKNYETETVKLDLGIARTGKEWGELLRELKICPICKQPTDNVKDIE